MIKKLYTYLRHPQYFLLWLDNKRLITLNDKLYIKMLYEKKMGEKLNLDNPQTFNEKLQWLKINDRKEIYTTMVDKYEAKKYVANIIGEEYIIPTLGVYDKFEDIDFDKLPNQFIIKCTHDSGSYIICEDKENFDRKKAKDKIKKAFKNNYYYSHREWPYKNVKPKIIIEQLLKDDTSNSLIDYKYFCFDGKAEIMYIGKDASKNSTTDFFDMEYNHLPIEIRDPNAKITPKKPKQFEKMKELAERLSKGIPHLRVDFYVINDKIYFGEMTFYHMAGFTKINPNEWNRKLGDMIKIK